MTNALGIANILDPKYSVFIIHIDRCVEVITPFSTLHLPMSSFLPWEPLFWINRLAALPFVLQHRDQNAFFLLFNKITPFFLTATTDRERTLPLFWVTNVGKKRAILVETSSGLLVMRNEKRHPIFFLLWFLISFSFLPFFLQCVCLSSTSPGASGM